MGCSKELDFTTWNLDKVVILGGGASLRKAQVNMIGRDWHVLAINDAYKLAPHASMLYACDNQWWEWHKGCINFDGWKITHEQQHRWDKILNGVEVANPPHKAADEVVVSNGVEGYEDKENRIRHGSNGGYQALHMAMRMGAKKIILLGYDMHANSGVSHWFGEHPNGKQWDGRYDRWVPLFQDLQDAAVERGIEIVNCTPNSALNCFVKKDLKEVI